MTKKAPQEHLFRAIFRGREFKRWIRQALKREKALVTGRKRHYSVGTTLYIKSHHIFITASTTKRYGEGIWSDPCYITTALREVLTKSADNKISKLFLPLLGSGHGRITPEISLATLMLVTIH